ncbi:hypothetical protein CLFE_016910 [Clostridium felsineum DSM 794]|nr:hypothetical protein CLFE_016910 [Clostridium felsineum DSM 794]
MLNIDSVDKVYLACGVPDLRSNIDGACKILSVK